MNAEPSVMIPISPAVDATGLFRNSGVHVSPPVASRLRLTNTATTCATTNTTTTRAINQRGTRRNSSTNRDFSFFLRSRINRMRSFHAPLTCSVPFIVFPRLDLFGVAYSGSPARPFQIASTTPVASSAGTAHHITKPTSQISFGAPVRCPTHSNARHTQGALAIPSAHETPAMVHKSFCPRPCSRNSSARSRTRNCVRRASPLGKGIAAVRNPRSACSVWRASLAQRPQSCRWALSHSRSVCETPSTRSCAINCSARACKSVFIWRFPFLGAQHAAPLQAQWRTLRRRSGFSSCSTSLERSAKCFQPAVQARLHGGKWNAQHASHFFNLQFFLEPEDEHLAINCGDSLQRCLNIFFRLLAEDLAQRRGIRFVHELQRMLLFGPRTGASVSSTSCSGCSCSGSV